MSLSLLTSWENATESLCRRGLGNTAKGVTTTKNWSAFSSQTSRPSSTRRRYARRVEMRGRGWQEVSLSGAIARFHLLLTDKY